MPASQWKVEFLNRLIKFSIMIVALSGKLPKTPAGFAIASQIIKSGTSVGANVQEAQDASSKKDFIQKLSISLREAKETDYWLKIIQASELSPDIDLKNIIKECGEIVAILTSSIKSSKSNL